MGKLSRWVQRAGMKAVIIIIMILLMILGVLVTFIVFAVKLVIKARQLKKRVHEEAAREAAEREAELSNDEGPTEFIVEETDVPEKESFFRKERFTPLIPSRKERFESSSGKRKVACVMVCCNMSEEDYEFIKNNMDYCDFFVIDSCNHRQQYSKKISELLPPGRFRTRRNDGWDTTAWKEFIFENYDDLKKYSYVILANNSCRYDFSIEDIISEMRADKADFYGLMRSDEITPHYQSYFIVVSSKLFASKDFRDYWERMPKIYTRKDAINNHELKFYENFHSKGWSCNTYYKEFVQPYFLSDYEHRSEVPKFIKKTAVENPIDKARYENLIRV